MVQVAHLTHRSQTMSKHLAHFARGQAQQGILAFLGHQLGVRACRAAELATLARMQLHIVDDGAHGNLQHGQGVAGFDVHGFASRHRIALLQAQGRQDIALLPVSIMQQGNAGAAVGVIFNMRHLGGHIELGALEVDDTIQALVAPAATASGDATIVVATSLFGQPFGQGLLGTLPGNLGKVRDSLEPPAGGSGLQGTNRHD